MLRTWACKKYRLDSLRDSCCCTFLWQSGQGRIFVRRLLADVGMPQSGAKSRWSTLGRGQRVVLGLEFIGDPDY